MNVKVEETKNKNEVKLEITVESEKFDNAIKTVFNKNAKYFNIPGFRKGKAPYHIVEKTYGAQILAWAIAMTAVQIRIKTDGTHSLILGTAHCSDSRAYRSLVAAILFL